MADAAPAAQAGSKPRRNEPAPGRRPAPGPAPAPGAAAGTPRAAGHPRAPGVRESGAGAASPLARARVRVRRPPMRAFNVNLVTVLNDPRARGRDTAMLTRDWGDTFVVPARVPPPRAPVNADGSSHAPRPPRPMDGPKLAATLTRHTEMYPAHARATSAIQAARQEAAAPVEAEGAAEEALAIDDTMLAEVPQYFFDAGFSLQDPGTFAQVLTNPAPSGGGGGGPPNARGSRVLQEKLSHYLDLVEVQLATQISKRSDRFFGALSSQEALSDNVRDACIAIAHFRQILARARATVSTKNLRVLQLRSMRINCQTLYAKLKLMAIVNQTQSKIQLLLATSDFAPAIELIETTKQVLRSELSGIHSLRHLDAQLTEMSRVVQEMMEGEFVSLLAARVRASGASASDPAPQPGSRRRNNSQPGLGGEVLDPEELTDRLAPLVFGALHQRNLKCLDSYRNALSSIIKGAINDVIVAQFKVSGTKLESEGKLTVSELRLLKWASWMSLLSGIFNATLAILEVTAENAVCVHDAVCSVCPEAAALLAARTAAARSPNKSARRPDGMQRAPAAAPPADDSVTPDEVDPAAAARGEHDSAMAMSEPGVDLDELDAPSFETLGVLPDEEADLACLDTGPAPRENGAAATKATAAAGAGGAEAEGASGVAAAESVDESAESSGIDPRLSLQALDVSNELLGDLCDQTHLRVSKLIQNRNKERVDSDVPLSRFVEFYRLANTFNSASERLVGRRCATLRSCMLTQAQRFLERFHSQQSEKLEWLLNAEQWQKVDVPIECQSVVCSIGNGFGLSTEVLSTAGQTSQTLLVGSKALRVVRALLMYLKVLAAYCQCADEMPMLTKDLVPKIVQSLKLYSTKTERLLLEAQVVNVNVGIKRVTAKHLALSSQVLEAIRLLVPCIRRRFEQHLPDKLQMLLGEFDSVVPLLEAHRRRIFEKVVEMIRSVWTECAKRNQMTWANAAKTEGAGVVCHQIYRLHGVLKAVLVEEDMATILQHIVVLINTQLKEAAIQRQSGSASKLSAVGIASDVVHYEKTLGKLSAAMPVQHLRSGLADPQYGLTLPPFVPPAAPS